MPVPWFPTHGKHPLFLYSFYGVTVIVAVAVLLTGGLNAVDHIAVTWKVPAVLGAMYVTGVYGDTLAPWIVPSGHGPGGGVPPNQLHCEPVDPFGCNCNSTIDQVTSGVGSPASPVTVAFSDT